MLSGDTLGIMLAMTRVQTLSGARAVTSASGFFFRRDDRLFLITSRHVCFDGPSDHVPDGVAVAIHADAVDLTRVQTLRLPLYVDGHASWHQAEDGGGDVDVAAIEIPHALLPQRHALQAFGPEDVAQGPATWHVGDSLAIPGYPLGFHDTVHHLPVVRAATIASAYGVRFQGRGYFLTDSRTHRGSSGAPVLRRDPDRGRHWCLLGVHSSRMDMSGRDAAVDESLGLNCAWYADVLMALTRAPTRTTS